MNQSVYVFNFQNFYLFLCLSFDSINNFIVLGNELYINNQFIFQNHKYLLQDNDVQENSFSLSFNSPIEHFTLHCIQCCSVSVHDRTTHCTNV